jgi:hypothetical protein
MSFHETKTGSLLTSTTLADDPPLRLARFLKHPTQVSTNEVGTNKPLAPNHHLDIELNEASTESFLRRRQPSDFDENIPGTSICDTTARSIASEPTSPHYPPISASTVFSKNAPPLYLPNLDNYMSSLPPAHFSALNNRSPSGMNMFPPMNLLENSGKTIEDLERNIVLAPSWTKRTTIFKGLAGISLGLAVRIFSRPTELLINRYARVPACCRHTILCKDCPTLYRFLPSSSALYVSSELPNEPLLQLSVH